MGMRTFKCSEICLFYRLSRGRATSGTSQRYCVSVDSHIFSQVYPLRLKWVDNPSSQNSCKFARLLRHDIVLPVPIPEPVIPALTPHSPRRQFNMTET